MATGCKDFSRRPDGTWSLKGKDVPLDARKRLDRMHIPPAWRNVVVSANPMAKVQAVGLDAAGRWQYRYSAKHIAEATQQKFDRIKSFSKDMPLIRKNILDGVRSEDPRAMLLRIEDKTAIRMGSMKDFKAKVKAYGLTTLKGEHIQIIGNRIELSFVAKKGIPVRYGFTDNILSAWLRERKSKLASMKSRMFPDVSPKKLNDYLREMAGGRAYTIKDFRTYRGTKIAYEELQKYAGRRLTIRGKKRVVKEVCEMVSRALHNTPAMAKSAYIDPMVWEIIGGL
jgi:DNA topoisomerase-1